MDFSFQFLKILSFPFSNWSFISISISIFYSIAFNLFLFCCFNSFLSILLVSILLFQFIPFKSISFHYFFTIQFNLSYFISIFFLPFFSQSPIGFLPIFFCLFQPTENQTEMIKGLIQKGSKPISSRASLDG